MSTSGSSNRYEAKDSTRDRFHRSSFSEPSTDTQHPDGRKIKQTGSIVSYSLPTVNPY